MLYLYIYKHRGGTDLPSHEKEWNEKKNELYDFTSEVSHLHKEEVKYRRVIRRHTSMVLRKVDNYL